MSTVASHLDALFADRESPIARDLKVNLSRLIDDGALEPRELWPAILALASAVQLTQLAALAREQMQALDFDPAAVREASEAPAIMAMLNTYYRFRHFLEEEGSSELDPEYQRAGLRMTSLGRPVLGKMTFEMIAFSLSVLNGCPGCVVSHEHALREAGVETRKIHELARLPAILSGVARLILN